jgi:L-ascorbate metabolism protein UlaG (beta-lactamase superfamily)
MPALVLRKIHAIRRGFFVFRGNLCLKFSSHMQLIKPRQQADTLLADIIKTRQNANPNGVPTLHIWWLGQSGFLVHHGGKTVLFDPYLSDSLTHKYAQTDKPHTRISELVIDPTRLTEIDVITSSHNHTDHLDAETLLPLFASNPQAQFVIPEANRAFVHDRLKTSLAWPGQDWPIGLNDGLTKDIAEIRFHGVPAAHNTIERNELGQCRFMGYVVEIGPFTIYHSGDTLWYDGIVETLQPFGVDVAFLPINGNRPERRVAGNLNADEAAHLGKAIGAKLTIPHHYDLFAFNTADPAEFVSACQKHQTPSRVMQLGERISYEKS